MRKEIVSVGLLAAVSFAALSLSVSPAAAQDAKNAAPSAADASTSARKGETFAVSGTVDKPDSWTVARLSKEFAAEIKTVDYVFKGKKGQARCVPLLTILNAAGPRLNPKAKNHRLAFTVFVRAKDGYTISFSWGELLLDVGKREVWVALDRNGQPIPGDDAPVELIVPGDEKPSRWVHGVAQIVVADGLVLTERREK